MLLHMSRSVACSGRPVPQPTNHTLKPSLKLHLRHFSLTLFVFLSRSGGRSGGPSPRPTNAAGAVIPVPHATATGGSAQFQRRSDHDRCRFNCRMLPATHVCEMAQSLAAAAGGSAQFFQWRSDHDRLPLVLHTAALDIDLRFRCQSAAAPTSGSLSWIPSCSCHQPPARRLYVMSIDAIIVLPSGRGSCARQPQEEHLAGSLATAPAGSPAATSVTRHGNLTSAVRPAGTGRPACGRTAPGIRYHLYTIPSKPLI